MESKTPTRPGLAAAPQPAPAADGLHCGACPCLAPYGPALGLGARCTHLDRELDWHDYWLAECLAADPQEGP